ncbi:hypothetical protein Tco_1128453 [Tanacetum coccineum]
MRPRLVLLFMMSGLKRVEMRLQNFVKVANPIDVTCEEEKLEENDIPLLDTTANIITPPFDHIISLVNTTSSHEAWVVAPPPPKTVALKRALVEILGEAEASSEKAPVPVLSIVSPSDSIVATKLGEFVLAIASSPAKRLKASLKLLVKSYDDRIKENHDLDVAHMNNDLFFGILILENDSEASSSDVIPTIVHTTAPNSEHVTKWTKDHPLDNIIGKLKRPVFTCNTPKFWYAAKW